MSEEEVTVDSLIKKVLSYNPDADVELLRKAYIFSREATAVRGGLKGLPT